MGVGCIDRASEPLVTGKIDWNFPMEDTNCFRLKYIEKGSLRRGYLPVLYSKLRHMALVR